MKSLVVILGLLVAAVQAAHGEKFPDDLTPMDVYMPVIEGAPEVQAPPKIIGGQQAVACDFTHQCAVVINNSGFCGGILISACWILTAAHCGNQGSSFQVRCGCIQWQSSGCVSRTAAQRIQHPNYNSPTRLANDIALLRVQTCFTLNNCIQPFPLAAANSGTFAGQTALASGWGRTTQNGGVSPNLMWVELPVITNAECRQFYGNTIQDSTLCVRAQSGRGTCNGDSGGPLTLRNRTVIGVVSFGSGRGCGVGDPSGFARVSSFRNWIRNNSGV